MKQSDNRIQHDRLLNESSQSNGKKGKSLCCSLSSSWIKTFLIFFTSIITAIALAFIGLGIYLSVVRNPILPLLLGETAYVNTYLLICIGILLIVVCIFGFVAISKNDTPSLKLYATILALALILQFCAAAAAVIYYKLAYGWNADALILKMNNEYHLADTDTTRAVDDLQKQFRCCGARNYRDWHGTGFEIKSKIPLNKTSTITSVVPSSCCIGPHAECGRIIHPSNIYYKGCMSAITDELNSTLFIICIVLLALAVVELVGMILACCYWRAPKYTYS
ncbi:tetraspanin [Echinococcus multilocularis]|uniref:Tetraspanin n=1 Tax=Echinococcus multilocularis TaxID=6211 RepID=A0A068YCJ6_ECHMU|nr:tetraspanin [Echinococcus multilocularis]